VSNEEIKKYYIYTEIRFMEDFDYKAMEALAPEQLKSGKPLFGKGGAFAPLLEKILNAAPEGEMDAPWIAKSDLWPIAETAIRANRFNPVWAK
jgi:hypothetical protein